jgi:lipopolysaccharide transport system permease protein
MPQNRRISTLWVVRRALRPLWAPFSDGWANRALIMRLTKREVEAKYRGSILGLAWIVLLPLFLLAVYTFVFGAVFKARWVLPQPGPADFSLVVFSGLLIFNLFAECVVRAPGLVLENSAYIKKVVFPLEVLGWVSLLGALFSCVVGAAVLLCAYCLTRGVPPASALLAPVLLIPVLFIVLGSVWFLSATGVYLRDLRQFVGVLTSALLFLSPVFFPVSAIPESLRWLVSFNPFTIVLELLRQVTFFGTLPSWDEARQFLSLLFGSYVFFLLGYHWFEKTKRGFADVV